MWKWISIGLAAWLLAHHAPEVWSSTPGGQDEIGERVRIQDTALKRIERRIDVGGRNLSCRVYGGGAPPVVLVSGFGAPQLYWSPVLPGLAGRTTVVTYDRAGYGESELGDKPCHGEQTARELHVLLEKLDIPGPYILLGHSYGGDIVRLFASMYPKDVAGLILEDAQHEDIMKIHESLMKGKERGIFDEMTSRQPDFTGGMGAETRARETTREQLRKSGPLPRVPYIVLTAGRRPPMPLFSAETNKKMQDAGLACQTKLVSLIPGGKHIVVKDAGHNLHHEKPEAVVQAVMEILDRIREEKPVR